MRYYAVNSLGPLYSEGALRNLEHQWHLIYIGWHALLGRLKVKHRTFESLQSKSGFLRRWSSR